MADSGIQRAFARFGATLKNVQWSVSAWNDADELVVSLWAHHHDRNSPAGTAEFADRLDRWRGPGNAEFRRNLALATERQSAVRVVIASTNDVAHVESGDDASKVKKSFDPKIDWIGRLVSLDGESYRFSFRRHGL